MKRSASTHGLAFILITMAIDSIGFGLIVPVLPTLLKDLIGASAAEAAPWGGYLSIIYAGMNFLAGPTLGSLSDRFGRRPVLLLSLGMLSIDFIIMGMAHSIWLLFIGRFLSGISGATFSTANAYIADVTEPAKRAQAFGMVGAAFGIGFIIGPGIGGLLGTIDARAPFFAAAGLAAINVLYGWLVLPESLPAEDRRPFDIARANPLGAFRHFSKLPTIGWFLVAMLLYQFAHFVYPSTWSFHGDARYGWGSREIGWSLMAVGLGTAVVQAGLIGPIMRKLGPIKTCALGLIMNVVSFIAFAFATQGWMIYAIMPFSALGAVGGPAMTALMSEKVPKNAQGELQGARSSVQALANMISPIVMTQVFSTFSAPGANPQFFGAAFLLAAMLALIALIPFSFGVRFNRKPAASQ